MRRKALHPNPSEKEVLTAKTVLAMHTGQGRFYSPLSSARLVAALLPSDRAHSIKCTEAKWRTTKTASYTEIGANTSRVGLSQVCTDHSNIDRHWRQPELSHDRSRASGSRFYMMTDRLTD